MTILETDDDFLLGFLFNAGNGECLDDPLVFLKLHFDVGQKLNCLTFRIRQDQGMAFQPEQDRIQNKDMCYNSRFGVRPGGGYRHPWVRITTVFPDLHVKIRGRFQVVEIP